MKALISVDLEGMPFIVDPSQLSPKRALYEEARKIATKITKITAEALNENGFDEVLIADSHGPMINILVEDLPEYTEIVRGFPRPLSMISWVEECSAVLFLGYHAKAGTIRSTFDHTYSGATIYRVEVNGIEASEYLLNSWVAGHYNVPSILVAGSEKLLEEDVKKFTPWAERVILKRSASRYAARSPSLIKIEKELKNAVKNAVAKLRRGEVKPLKVDTPVKVKVTFMKSGFADAAELIPGVERISGTTVKYKVENMVEAYKMFELLVLTATAINAITQPK